MRNQEKSHEEFMPDVKFITYNTFEKNISTLSICIYFTQITLTLTLPTSIYIHRCVVRIFQLGEAIIP